MVETRSSSRVQAASVQMKFVDFEGNGRQLLLGNLSQLLVCVGKKRLARALSHPSWDLFLQNSFVHSLLSWPNSYLKLIVRFALDSNDTSHS